MKLIQILMIVVMAGTVGCSSAPKEDTGKKPDISREYVEMKRRLQQSDAIAPGYILELDHSADQAVSGKYEVDFDGRLKLPYQVTVRAAGRTPKELERAIARGYRSYFKRNNRVKVRVTERKYLVEVRGVLLKPGRYSVRLDTSLEELVSLAGGFQGSGAAAGQAQASPGAKPEYLRIVRPNYDNPTNPATGWYQLADYFYKYDTEPEFLWRGGEKIFFQMTAPAEADIKKNWHTISVIGEVREPKEHPVLPNADLLTYITRSGGPTAQADLTQIEIIRRAEDDGTTVDMTNGDSVRDLQAGDVVLVRAQDNTEGTVSKILNYAATITGIATSVLLIILL